MITITDGQTDVILDDIQEDEFWQDNHRKSLKDNMETFDFVTFANKGFSEYLAKRNRIIIPDEDGKYIEFIIHNTRKYRSPQGGLFIEVYTMASYTELATSKVIRPQKTPSWTPKQHVEFALAGTGYEVGQVDHGGFRTLTIEQHTNPFAYLKRVASVYDFELHFRIETNGNRVTRRYVDLIKRVGNWQGREVEFGKDLLGIERKEDTSKIVTALIGLGPERDDGTRLELLVEDKEALARWGRNGQHIIDIYEPESTDTEMTEERLRTLTENELKKRVNSVVEYTADIADLEKVSGLEHEKIRFGDVVRIKDIDFNPPLYLEARIHTMERSIKKNGYKTVTLGDYIEYTEEEVTAIWKSLKAEIAKKISMADVLEVVYTKPEVDSKDADVYRDSTHYADNVSETKKQEAIQTAAVDATNKANTAEQNAKNHADTVAEQKKQEAIQQAVADAETKINTAKTELEADIALKADAEWVNGQLVLKENAITKSSTAPVNPTAGQLWLDTSVTPNVLKRWGGSAWVKATPTSAGEVGAYTKTEVDNALNSKVSVTQYTADMNGVVARLDSAESRITQNENEIATKVSLTQYQQDQEDLSSQLSQMSTQIQQQADQIALKANKTDVYTKTQVDQELGKKVDTTVYNQKIGELTTSINGISANVSNLQTTVGQHGASISNLQSQVNIHAGQIASKVDATYVDSAIGAIEIGGRNYFVVKDALENKALTWTNGIEFSETGSLTSGFIPCAPLERFICNFVNQQTFYYNSNKEYIGAIVGRIGVIPENTDNVSYKPSTMPDDNVPAYVRIVFRDNFLNGKTKEEIKIMLEKGNKATDWTPAPEDTQAEIDDVYQYASSEIQQLAGQVSTKAEASTVTALGNRVTTAEQNISALESQISQKVSQSTFNALENRVTQAESTITQTADNVTVAFNRIDSIDGKLNSATTIIDETGVTVKNGSFFLVDEISNMKSHAVFKRNLISDHSFEALIEGAVYSDDTRTLTVTAPNPWSGWFAVGNPKLHSIFGTDAPETSVMFGLKEAVVNNSNYLYQYIHAVPNQTYAFSVHARKYSGLTAGNLRVRIRCWKPDGFGDPIYVLTKTFDFPTSGNTGEIARYGGTFTTTSDTKHIEISVMTTSSNWIVVDGVQLVEGNYPAPYVPEDDLYAFLHGLIEGRGFTGDYTIVGYGSNENGNFVRFGQGLQICWFQTEINMAINNQYGVLYQNSMKWTYPATFADIPTVCVGEARWSTGASWGTPTTTERLSTDIRVIDVASRNAGPTRIKAIAIGRWK